MSNEMYYNNLSNTIDVNGGLRNSMYVQPQSDVNEKILMLQRKVNELKECLADRESQLDWIKRTLKYTEVFELKQENEMLFNECKRLK